MSSLNDTIALGLVLVLLFGAAALYLYTRVQQCEQKLNLVESILLDIKMGAELREYPDMGITAATGGGGGGGGGGGRSKSAAEAEAKAQDFKYEEALYSAALDEAAIDSIDTTEESQAKESSSKESETSPEEETKQVAVTSAQPAKSKSLHVTKQAPLLSVNYEAMTLVELKELAKQRSIRGCSTMRRSQILEALKTNESSPHVEGPIKLNDEVLTSLLEHASSFENVETLETSAAE